MFSCKQEDLLGCRWDGPKGAEATGLGPVDPNAQGWIYWRVLSVRSIRELCPAGLDLDGGVMGDKREIATDQAWVY